MLEQVESKLISQKVTDREGYVIQSETINKWTINLDDIHSIGEADGLYFFDDNEGVIAITYKSLRGTLYFKDSYMRIFNLWKQYIQEQNNLRIQQKFN